MKKKLLLLTLIAICLVTFTGCGNGKTESGNKETLTYKDETLKLETTFKYAKEDGFKFKTNVEGGKFAEIEFSNEKQNLDFDMYYTESSKDIVDTIKEERSSKKFYKEYKFDKYSAYVYSDFETNLYLIVDIEEKDGKVIELFVAMDQINFSKDEVVFDIFNNDVMQNFFNSIKVEEIE